MYVLFTFTILLFASSELTEGAKTTCAESQKNYANLCFRPKPIVPIDWKWDINSQPSEGWHSILGNDITRLHLAEVIRGKKLSPKDNYNNLCFRAKVLHAEDPKPKDRVDGQFLGYGNLTSKWNCNISADFSGVILCNVVTTAGTKYHDSYNYYTTYSDSKNIQIGVICFPNGQVGWISFVITESLTNTEKKTITDHVTSIGFTENTIVTMYDESKCSNEIKN